MTRLFHYPSVAHAGERRLAGVGLMILVHAALLLGWQLARTRPPAQPDNDATAMTWIRLVPPQAKLLPAPHAPVTPAAPVRPALRPTPAVIAAAPVEMTPAADMAPVLSAAAPPRPSAADILDRARRSAGAIDRALTRQNRPYIVAPPDSPELRMQAGMQRAHDLAPPKLWEAPKVDELVNQTGDGARRTRVITANGTYCMSERATNTSVDMVETFGKLRLTNCPQHEDTATQQDWRTARGD